MLTLSHSGAKTIHKWNHALSVQDTCRTDSQIIMIANDESNWWMTMNSFPCNISIESWNGDQFLYKDNLGLWSARNMRASCRMSAPVMVIVMKEKFLCLISRVFCLVLRIENLFIRLTRRHNMPHITVISSFHLLHWIYQTSCYVTMKTNRNRVYHITTATGKAKY